MKTHVLFLTIITLFSGLLFAQGEPPFATGLRAPAKIIFTHQGNLIVAEQGTAAANTGRVSIVDRTSATRRVLIDGLPSAVYTATTPAEPSGPDGLALQGTTLYVTIGSGNVSVLGPVTPSDTPNPAGPSSPIFSSLLALRTSRTLDLTTGEFVLLPSQHAELKSGSTITLTNRDNETLTVKLVADFPDYVPNPRPDFAGNVRISNPFGVVARGDTLFVVDASMNVVYRVDATDGTFTTLTTFAPLINPGTVGPPRIDYVPDSIRIRGNDLLVTNLTGFPFLEGKAEVRRVDITSGAGATLLDGLTSAIDVVSLGESSSSPLLVLEFSASMLTQAPGRLRLFKGTDAPVLIAGGLITPTSMAVDQRTGEIFITNIGPAMITRVRAAGRIPAGTPNAVISGIGSVNGGFGSRWMTAVQISNPHAFPISGQIVFHRQATAGQISDPAVSYTLAPFETRSYSDFAAAAGTSGIGSADVIAAVGGAPVTVVRIFDDASPGKPSAQVPLVDPADALTTGTRGTLITPHDPSTTRFNVGIRTLSEGVTLTIERHSTSGAVTKTVHKTYPADYFVQFSASDFLGAAAGADEALTFTVDQGSAIVYGVGVDNSGQGLTFQIAWPSTDL